MALIPYEVNLGALRDSDTSGGTNYYIGEVVSITDLNDVNVSLFSDRDGTVTLPQNGVSNVTDAAGVFAFFVAAGNYKIKSLGSEKLIDLGSGDNAIIPLTLADFKASTEVYEDGAIIYITDRGDNFEKISGTGTANGFNIIASDQVDQSISLILKDKITSKSFGVGSVLGSTSDTDGLNVMLNTGVKNIELSPSLKYNFPAGAQTVNAYGISVGDPSFDVLSLYSVMIDGYEDVTINAVGADISTDYGMPICFYKSKNCRWIGGNFSRTGTDQQQIDNQSTAVMFVRSGDCIGERIFVDGYYRNLWAYRSLNCGFTNKCRSINARYFNFYCASVIDIALPGYTNLGDESRMFVNSGCVAIGGRIGNYFIENADCDSNYSFDLDLSTVAAIHIKTEQGNCSYTNNVVIESSVQNSGFIATGLSAQPPIALGVDISNVNINSNKVIGCYQSIKVSGVSNFEITHNSVYEYYQTGMSIITDSIGGSDFNISNGLISDNSIGNMSNSSTRSSSGNDKNAGLQIEKNAGLDFDNVLITDNSIDAKGLNTSKTPEFGMYVEAAKGTLQLGVNNAKDNITSLLPVWTFSERRSDRTLSVTSQGTTGSPAALDPDILLGGQLRMFNSQMELPQATAGMRVLVSSTSSTNRLYVNGASSGSTGSDSIYQAGQTSTNRNLQFSVAGTFVLSCPLDGQWHVSVDQGATVTLIP